jgi:uncharacterized protein (DUF302 family)
MVSLVGVNVEHSRPGPRNRGDEATHTRGITALRNVGNGDDSGASLLLEGFHLRGVTVEQMEEASEYGYTIEVSEGYDEAVTRSRLALRAEGFSIITEMHVGGMLGAEQGSGRQYLIMGAWAPPENPTIDPDPSVAMHLPCNFVVFETGASAVVAALDPADDWGEDGGDGVAGDASSALTRVFERIGATAS